MRLRQSWSLYRTLVAQDLRIRVVGSRLGMMWLVLQPLLYMTFTTVVFYGVLGVRFEQQTLASYLLGLLAGLVVWLGFNEGLGKAAPALMDRAHLIRNVRLPRPLIPLVPLAAALLYQLVCLLLLIGVGAAAGQLRTSLWQLLPALVLEGLFLMGAAWLASVLTVFYRDVQYLLGFVLMAWLYLTPIFYPADLVPDALRFWLVEANPMALLVVLVRGALWGTPVAPEVWLALSASSVLAALAGYAFFRRLESAVVDLL